MTTPDFIHQIEQSKTRQHFTDVRHVNVRWEPYKPDGSRQMKANGRWQEQVGSGDYWRWQNCDRPAFAHDPSTDEAAIANARNDALEDAARVAEDMAGHEFAKDVREMLILCALKIRSLNGGDQ